MLSSVYYWKLVFYSYAKFYFQEEKMLLVACWWDVLLKARVEGGVSIWVMVLWNDDRSTAWSRGNARCIDHHGIVLLSATDWSESTCISRVGQRHLNKRPVLSYEAALLRLIWTSVQLWSLMQYTYFINAVFAILRAVLSSVLICCKYKLVALKTTLRSQKHFSLYSLIIRYIEKMTEI